MGNRYQAVVFSIALTTAACASACGEEGCSSDQADETPLLQLRTTANLTAQTLYCSVSPEGKATSSNTLVGLVSFTSSKSEQSFTLITYKVCGLTPGLHGLHVHNDADFSNGCLSTGDHYNPFNNNHGAATDKFKHRGDLGNILADEEGCAEGDNLQSDLPLEDILGRAIVVHGGEDDLGQGGDDASRGPAGGNSGPRIACGEITQKAPSCPDECVKPECVSGEDGFKFPKQLDSTSRCAYFCTEEFGGAKVRYCGVGPDFTDDGSINCLACYGW